MLKFGLLGLFLMASVVPARAEVLASTCETGLAAYKTTLHPVQRQHCARCHGDGGMALGHSVADPVKAYAVTRGLVNFDELRSSRLMDRVRERHWLQYGGAPIPLEPQQLEALLLDWWSKGESSCSQDLPLLTTKPQALTGLPTGATQGCKNFSWDLGEISPALAGCRAEVCVRKFTDRAGPVPGSYHVRAPLIACPDRKLRVSGVWLPVSGQRFVYENYFAPVNTVLAPPSDWPKLQPIMPAGADGILIERNVAGDTLAIGFEHIEIAQ